MILDAEQQDILLRLDVAAFRQWLIRNGAGHARVMASDDLMMLCAMHKTRYEAEQLPRLDRTQSYLWLKQQGFRRFNGEPLLPSGRLPGDVSYG